MLPNAAYDVVESAYYVAVERNCHRLLNTTLGVVGCWLKLSNVVEMLSDIVCFRILSDVVRCCQMLSAAVGCCRMLSDVVGCCQMLSYVVGFLILIPLNTIFELNHMYPLPRELRRVPSNCKFYEHYMRYDIFRLCQESNSQPVSYQLCADSIRSQ